MGMLVVAWSECARFGDNNDSITVNPDDDAADPPTIDESTTAEA